jgi:hypothetical protein
MENQLNTGSLNTLKFGQTLLVNARKVANGKIQLEFAEIINPQQEVNVLQAFNASDARFQTKARRAWQTAEPVDAVRILGIEAIGDMTKYSADGKLELNVLNPTMGGQRLRVQIVETTEPRNQFEADNVATRAKRRGVDGDFILHQGQYIFTRAQIVTGEPKHTFLEADPVGVAPSVFGNVNTATGEIHS